MVARCLLILTLLSCAGAARADVVSVAEESCRYAKRGDLCEAEYERVGTCQPSGPCIDDESPDTPSGERCSNNLVCDPSAAPPNDGCDAGAIDGPFGLGALALGLLLAVGLRRRRA